ncbi:DUF1566 domain-containing protein [Aestuariibacter halophilus]|uniref:DUF1566 domain-containing protein n=1 Tax=Fluctibacter halophilus TaxID=226011 RepID=A0ABS8G7X0_9ALTE|nr:DUF1566 domain-containing protein [Aestuariibacter halophilus]MCC2616628.1 DUF1566 domain-containing protein [Aestuariibacter halophilus]
MPTIRLPGLLILLAALLSGCSGGSLDSDSDDQNRTVLVTAGANRSVSEGANVTLTGEASGEATPFTYSWSVVPALTIEQADTSVPEVTFTAPTTIEPLEYTFTLLVTDANGNQGSDSVIITVEPVNELPRAVITVRSPDPVPSPLPAGIDVVLSGEQSVDIDAPATGAAIAQWQWAQTEGPSVLQNVSLNGDSVAFTTPLRDDASQLGFSLTVTDQEGGSHTASILLSVLSQADTVPTVDAGTDHTVYPGELIALVGDANSTVPAATPLAYRWLNDSTLEPTIADSTALKTYAIAPMVSSSQVISFSLAVTDRFGNVVEDAVAITVKPMPLSPMNDTGVAAQASLTQVATTYQSAFLGQDGQRGRDVIAANGVLEKAGQGSQGFDFTRLDVLGDEIDDSATSWACVRDNVSGLVWEVKDTSTSLHGRDHTYSWYHTTNNGGDQGDTNGAGTSCSLASCNTTAFIAAVNAQGLCNFYDWRLPTHNELMSIAHFGKTSGVLLDTDYFPNSTGGGADPLWYWTRIPSADGVQEDAQNAWAIDFLSGNDNFLNKSTPVRVRLVRGGR